MMLDQNNSYQITMNGYQARKIKEIRNVIFGLQLWETFLSGKAEVGMFTKFISSRTLIESRLVLCFTSQNFQRRCNHFRSCICLVVCFGQFLMLCTWWRSACVLHFRLFCTNLISKLEIYIFM